MTTKICSRYHHGWPLCASECRAQRGVWSATLEFFDPKERVKGGLQSACRACARAGQQTPEFKAHRQTLEFKARRRAHQAAEMIEAFALAGSACQYCGEAGLSVLEWNHSKPGGRNGGGYPKELQGTGGVLARKILQYFRKHGCLPDGLELLSPGHRVALRQLSRSAR